MTTQERALELSRLNEFFKTSTKPEGPIKIAGYMKLNNIQTFIDTNITRAGIDIGNERSESCIYRLRQLEEYLLSSVSR